MRVKFSRLVDVIPAWNDNDKLPVTDQIKAKIKPMEVSDLISLLDVTTVAKAADGNINTSAAVKLIGECGHMLKKYVTVENLEDDDGPVTIENILQYGRYMGLATELLMRCAEASMPSDTAEGNSAPPLG